MRVISKLTKAIPKMLTLSAAVLYIHTGPITAETSDHPAIMSFIKRLIDSAASDGRFDPSRFDCQTIHKSSDGGRLLECFDKQTAIGSMWANDSTVENVAVSIVFSELANSDQRRLSPVGDIVVVNQNELSQLKNEFSLLTTNRHQLGFDECKPPTELAATAAPGALTVDIENPARKTRITMLFSGSKYSLPGSTGNTEKPTENEIVASFIVVNRLEEFCSRAE